MEVCNLQDDNCDGSLPPEERDLDADGFTPCDGDCNDFAPNLGPFDIDGDGHEGCAGDCHDLDPAIHPGAYESACSGIDSNCDGVVSPHSSDDDGDGASECAGDCDDSDALVGPQDADGDGYSGCEGDCDDAVAMLNPSDADGDGTSTCQGDCDDGDPARSVTDLDGDGFFSCFSDCDDEDSGRNPAVAEACDGVDTDCSGDGAADEVDADGDGWLACEDCDDGDDAVMGMDEDGDGLSECAGDCADAQATVYPGSPDPPLDGLDQDCDGVDGVDADGDGFPGNLPPPWPESDCDDSDPALNPSDTDGDGYTTCPPSCASVCPPGPTPCGACAPDCDDLDASVHPDAPDGCDGVDSDCAGDLADELDGDGDGVSLCAGDCDDADPGIGPFDADGDGWDACIDCDGGDAGVHPGVWESAVDLADDDCDGTTATSLGLAAGHLSPGPGNYPSWRLGCDGDVDLDGQRELIAGDPLWETADGIKLGRVSVVAGADLPAAGEVLAIDAIETVALVGTGADDGFGHAVHSEGDGLPDLVVGVPQDDLVGNNAGAVAVFFGATLASASGEILLSAADRILVGEGSDDHLGHSLTSLADLDGDGADELLVAAPHLGSSVGSNVGRLYLWMGADLAAAPAIAPVADGAFALLEGTEPGGALGVRMAALGDVDGDGFAEVAVRRGFLHRLVVVSGAELAGGGTLDDASTLAEVDVFPGHAQSLSGGDSDGDGLADLHVGSMVVSRAWRIPGSVLAGGGSFSPGATLTVQGPATLTGAAVAVIPDLDGDGVDELAVGGHSSDEWGVNAGAVGVFGAPMAGTVAFDEAPLELIGSEGDAVGSHLCVLDDQLVVGDGGGTLRLLPLPPP